jgi:hypothetical protein
MNNRGANLKMANIPPALGQFRPPIGSVSGRGRADWFAYKGRPAAKPKAPTPAPKGAPEPQPEAPKPPQPGKEAGPS